MPYWEEPKYNDPDEIDGPGDVTLPSTMHHMQVKAELDHLVRDGAITDVEAEEAMKNWRAKQEISDDRKLKAAVSRLEERGLLDDDQAKGIMEQIAG